MYINFVFYFICKLQFKKQIDYGNNTLGIRPIAF